MHILQDDDSHVHAAEVGAMQAIAATAGLATLQGNLSVYTEEDHLSHMSIFAQCHPTRLSTECLFMEFNTLISKHAIEMYCLCFAP